jgi:TonB family protein
VLSHPFRENAKEGIKVYRSKSVTLSVTLGVMMRPFLLLFFVPFLALATFSPAQTSAPVMPKDASELMRLAAGVNGLDSQDLKPWHLKATYQVFDDNGAPRNEGTFEAWWVEPTKYKLSYTSTGFNQVEYRNGAETRMTGDAKWPPMPEALIVPKLFRPLMTPEDAKAQRFSASDVKFEGLEMKCLHFVPQSSSSTLAVASSLPAYCFGKGGPELRADASFGEMQTVYNNIVEISGHYVAKQIRLGQHGHPLLNVDIVALDPMSSISDADLSAPADALPAPPRKIMVSAGVLQGNKLSGVPPQYPYEARSNHIQGTVVIQVTITATGEIGEMRIVSGPPPLQRAALDAVKTWRYKPYLLNGEAVQVESQVNVVFSLGG